MAITIENKFEIIDSNGTIHGGTQEEMEHAFDVMTNSDEHSSEDIDKWDCEWSGDLKLVEVHTLSR